MKRITVILTTIAIGLTLSACGSNKASDNGILDGTYKSAGSSSQPTFIVTISNGKIAIDMVLDNETSGLYWKGSAPLTVKDFTSSADMRALDASLLGSGSKTKEFRVDGNSISFDVSMMGMSYKIRATK